MSEIKNIIKLIQKNKNISIFFHVDPDFDALGSAYGLRSYLKQKYPGKNVMIIGLDFLDDKVFNEIFKYKGELTKPEFIEKSLGIVLDTANVERIFTSLNAKCKELVKIDHHPDDNKYGDAQWVNPKYSSTCEMLVKLINEIDSSYLTAEAARYLYAGICTDSGFFQFPSTSANTFKTIIQLMETGFDRQEVHNAIKNKSIKDKKFDLYCQKLIKYDLKKKVAYMVIPKGTFKKFDVKPSSMVYLMANLKEIDVWMSIYWDGTKNIWKGSIRGRDVDVREIAKHFGGGGHKLASGFNLSSSKEIKKVINLVK